MSSPPRRPTDRADANEIADFAPVVALAARIVDALPPGSPTAWRGPTYRAVLTAVIRDRIENETGDLEDGDAASLSDFVRAAAAAAAAAPAEHRDDAYEIVLDGLLQDWVENWNEPVDEDDDE
ncbi:MAG TPA: hypothetical protein VE953_11345 [Terriglobales bacterium]|nr:hypothetical protein [Terriglobales bacterium]